MQGNHIAVIMTLLFFAGMVWGFVAIVIHVYRSDRSAAEAAALASETQAAVARAAAREELERYMATLPEALPVTVTTVSHLPVLGNAVIRDEALWQTLQRDLIAVNVADMDACVSGEAAVAPSDDPDAASGTEMVRMNPSSTSAQSASVRDALLQGGYVIVECCRPDEAAALEDGECRRRTSASSRPASSEDTSDSVAPSGNHVRAPGACFYVYKPSATPYGQSEYLSAAAESPGK
ncbi:hypothetical protein NESM_000213100 [Novymonas esmeraldas]|uniref:Flp pilus-assembly TadG-like N-terminal domain-containing protein n=1 Tax=Novymonas esmeraldas TaxID=1808958 RepID=A0AAW0F6Q3_9TRYP